MGAAWLHGLLRDDVSWRGNRLRVLRGSRLEPLGTPGWKLLRAAGAR